MLRPLRHAVDFIVQELDPIGIVATGTIIRGAAHKNRDLDLYILHHASYPRRIQRFFDGVPAEIFVNPAATVPTYFREEDRDGRRLTAHMMLEYLCKSEHGQIPRRKDLIEHLKAQHPDVAARASEFFRASHVNERARLGQVVAPRGRIFLGEAARDACKPR